MLRNLLESEDVGDSGIGAFIEGIIILARNHSGSGILL